MYTGTVFLSLSILKSPSQFFSLNYFQQTTIIIIVRLTQAKKHFASIKQFQKLYSLMPDIINLGSLLPQWISFWQQFVKLVCEMEGL